MSGFDRRGEGFEAKAALDEEIRFKAMARRAKMLGLWAATKFGMTGTMAEDYARDVARADQQEPGDEDIIRKLTQDSTARGGPVTEAEIRHELARLQALVMQEITKSS